MGAATPAGAGKYSHEQIQSALSKVDDLKPYKGYIHQDDVRVPMKSDPLGLGELSAGLRHSAPRVDAIVAIDDLTAIQRSVEKSVLSRYIRSGLEGAELPVVIRYQGSYLLLDGTHRAVAQKLLGDKEIRVKLADFDDESPVKHRIVPPRK